MSYPNSALPAWQLATMAVVMVAALAVWLILVYSAAREPRKSDMQPHAASESAALTRTENPRDSNGRRQPEDHGRVAIPRDDGGMVAADGPGKMTMQL